MNFTDIEEVEAWKYYTNARFLWKPARVLRCHRIRTGKLSVLLIDFGFVVL